MSEKTEIRELAAATRHLGLTLNIEILS